MSKSQHASSSHLFTSASNVSSKTLTYAVMDSDDLDGSSQADDFLAYVEETFPETFEHWTKYGTESEFEDVIKASGYSREAPSANVIGFSAGLVFSSGSPNWEYTVRFGSTPLHSIPLHARRLVERYQTIVRTLGNRVMIVTPVRLQTE